jgi:hypothetical protein
VTITFFGAWALVQPFPKPPLDFRVGCAGMAAAEVLAHQVHAGWKRSSAVRKASATRSELEGITPALRQA